MTLGSLFDGIGGFPLATVNNGITPVWASEIKPSSVSITKRHFPDMKHLGDVTSINGEEIEPVDIISFGSPCQGFSIAGKRGGLSCERSGLFTEAVRVIKEMRENTHGKYPERIIFENVPGLFSSNGGEDFRTIIEEIAGIAERGVSIPRPPSKFGWFASGAAMGDGWSLAWRVMDAQYWGVPQRRKRVFLVADFTGGRAAEILFKPDSLQGYTAEGGTAREGTAAGTKNGVRAAGLNGNAGAESDVAYTEETAATLRATMSGCCLQYAVDFGRSGDRIQMNAGKSVTLQGEGGGGAGKTGLYCLPVYSFQCFGGYAERSMASTLRTNPSNDSTDLIRAGYTVRRLTPLECERLQGFPDGWTEYGYDGRRVSDNARYQALGNSVAVPCVDFIMGRLSEKQTGKHLGRGIWNLKLR